MYSLQIFFPVALPHLTSTNNYLLPFHVFSYSTLSSVRTHSSSFHLPTLSLYIYLSISLSLTPRTGITALGLVGDISSQPRSTFPSHNNNLPSFRHTIRPFSTPYTSSFLSYPLVSLPSCSPFARLILFCFLIYYMPSSFPFSFLNAFFNSFLVIRSIGYAKVSKSLECKN